MGRIPEHVLQELRDRVDIVELVGESVQLRKRGRNWVGLCPFHRERTPSFNVNPELQIYKCFGCGVGGNALTFLMAREGLEFPEAARRLATRVGLEIPQDGGEARERWEPLVAANAFAAEFYERALRADAEAEAARDYLARREIGDATRDAFRLGWASRSWDALLTAARAGGVPEASLVEAGLVSRSERTGGLYDRFRGRVMFPVSDATGKVVGFSGRLLADEGDAPKYLNSPETSLFRKGALLFGLSLTKNAIRRAEQAVLVEGNFDLLSLHARGLVNVAAPLGTALTAEQAALLKRYAPRAVLLYDGDAAGLKAAFRGADELLARGLEVRIAFLPAGADPDGFVRERGVDAMRELVRDAPDAIDAKLRVLRERLDLSRVDTRRRAVGLLLRSLRRIEDPITRQMQTEHVALELGADPALLVRSAASPERRSRAEQPEVPRPREGSGEPARAARVERPVVGPGLILDEKYLLLALLGDTSRVARARSEIEPGDLGVPGYRRIYEGLLARLDAEGDANPRRVLDALDPEAQALLSELLLAEDLPEADERLFTDALKKVKDDALAREVAEMGRVGGDVRTVWERKREQLGLRDREPAG